MTHPTRQTVPFTSFGSSERFGVELNSAGELSDAVTRTTERALTYLALLANQVEEVGKEKEQTPDAAAATAPMPPNVIQSTLGAVESEVRDLEAIVEPSAEKKGPTSWGDPARFSAEDGLDVVDAAGQIKERATTLTELLMPLADSGRLDCGLDTGTFTRALQAVEQELNDAMALINAYYLSSKKGAAA